MSKISNIDLFRAVSEAVVAYGEKGLIPDSYISTNIPLYRGVDKKYILLAPNGLVMKSSAEAAITPRDGNPNSNNRFSGMSPISVRGSNVISGLYLFRDENAGIAEMMHYSEKMNTLPVNTQSKRISVPHLMATKAIFTIYPRKPLILANLSVQKGGANVTRFLNDIENTPSVKNLLKGVKLSDKILDGGDYSVSRAFGMALSRINYFDGLESQTARISDRPEFGGDNICIFGSDSSAIPFLNPDCVLLTFSSIPLFDQYGNQLKMNDNDENLINQFIPNATRTEYTIKIEVDSGLKQGMRVASY